MRGNPGRVLAGRARRGSIPAHAGEPQPTQSTHCASGVYPRTCGGTQICPDRASRHRGLSPHMRGNLYAYTCEKGDTRSIPAHAGEPAKKSAFAADMQVYPRTCGGTAAVPAGPGDPGGLSPHMRGNPFGKNQAVSIKRSIPAHAGEPGPYCLARKERRVYPRTCGGTRKKKRRRGRYAGLSPHMRGNPRRRRPTPPCIGSIPAHAGEPRARSTARMPSSVYPRTCGGTWSVLPRTQEEKGLSPHMRGNPSAGRDPSL